jgi:fermentation-respiration switch protein FrsA (DUF1100 family)
MTIDRPPTQQRSQLRRLLRALFVFGGLPYFAVLILMTVFQRSLIYGPDSDAALNASPAAIRGAHTEAIRVKAADNLQLNGWHIVTDSIDDRGQADAGNRAIARPVILYFCGNAGNRAYRVDVFSFFVELGADVICFDYRGFGDNAGSPGEAAFADDAQAIWRHVTGELQIEHDRIVIFGESLGGGVATRLASDLSAAGTPPAGLVLRSTFTRLTDVAAWHHPWLPVRWLMFDRYPSVERIGAVTCPILILHGRRDTIIPFEEAEQLLAAAPEESQGGIPRRLVALETADHNDVLSAERDAFRSGMQDFLKQLKAE